MASVIRRGIANYHPNCWSEHPSKHACGTVEMPWGWLGDLTAAILLDHCEDAAGEVAEAVGEVAVVALNERVVTEISVLPEYGLAQKIVAKRIHAEDMDDGPRANDVAERLAHLGTVHEQPAVRPDLFRQREAGGHQKGRPVHGVEANDLLAHEMNIGGPESSFFILRAAHGAEVRSERVEPDVKDVRLFTGYGNAPANRGSRDAEIAEAAFDKAQNFIAAGFRLDEIGMLGVPIEKRLLKGRELEIEIGFGDGFRRTATIGAVLAGLHVDVGIVVDAVLPRVVTGIDETIVAALLEEPLHGVSVFQIRGADKFVALDAEFIPKGAPFRGHFRDEFGFGNAGFFGGALDVDAVFVGAGGHDHVVAAHAFVAADGVAHDGRVGVADVRQAVRVIDRRGQIIFGFSRHRSVFTLQFSARKSWRRKAAATDALYSRNLAKPGRSSAAPLQKTNSTRRLIGAEGFADHALQRHIFFDG